MGGRNFLMTSTTELVSFLQRLQAFYASASPILTELMHANRERFKVPGPQARAGIIVKLCPPEGSMPYENT